ncbi:MAG TPA: RNA-binding protein [Lachnospiraceae bacterium]|nr:RNA-binding protein [Lachnospiraceae bacterium]HCH96561.1 RNA-binding protein [Lachnospiraceae bacterium]
MLEIGKRQLLTIVKKVDFGVYLAKEQEADPEEKVLLPRKEVPENVQPGDEIEVFLYRDSKDRMIATVRQPKLSLGEVAVLRVKENGKIGAFLDWGLEKDLLLPFREQVRKVRPGEECLVALYLDKSKRLCATMKVYHYLRTDSPYEKDQKVTGTLYEISDNFGAFVAVDNCYSALIPKKEPLGNARVGDTVEARVTEVLKDGKLSLSLREKAYIQMNEDAQKLLKLLEEQGGELPVGDKSSPEKIKELTGMSKNEFKRAAGNLYKQRLVQVKEHQLYQLSSCE